MRPSRGLVFWSASPYAWGDPFPTQLLDCGWTLEDRAFPLLDPNPCVGADGTPTSAELGYYLAVGSTQTLRLPDGRFRMYFVNPKLAQVTTDPARSSNWPLYDADGRLKFWIDELGAVRTGLRNFYVDAEGGACFGTDYVCWLDSVDGITFPMYAPFVAPTSGSECADVSYAGATAVFVDEATGFRAGWNLTTAIRASGASVVYRDVSVVYLAAVGERGTYLMFAVECDGRGKGSAGADLVAGTGGCEICVNSACITDVTVVQADGTVVGVPDTRLVYFICEDADFRDGVSGPYPFYPGDPDRTRNEWVGVPQAWTSPDGAFLFVFQGGNMPDYPYAGIQVARVSSIADEVRRRGPSGWIGLYSLFRNLGRLEVSCGLPGYPGASFLPTDPHFVFCGDQLHLYFTANPDGNTTLRVVGHAVSSATWDESMAKEAVEASPPDTWAVGWDEPATIGAARTLAVTGLGPSLWPSVLEAEERELSDFVAVCLAVDINAALGFPTDSTATVTDEDGDALTVAVNDPNVYQAADGTWVMILHCQALGGMVRLTAPASVACGSEPAC